MALHGTKALEAWCKSITASYPEVNIVNMTTSWRSGMGFCAIIHHYCPHLIDWDTLDPDNIYDNNKLAFDIAEQHLGIPSLLDPQDMLECELLDKLSILTYLSQYYQVEKLEDIAICYSKIFPSEYNKLLFLFNIYYLPNIKW